MDEVEGDDVVDDGACDAQRAAAPKREVACFFDEGSDLCFFALADGVSKIYWGAN